MRRSLTIFHQSGVLSLSTMILLKVKQTRLSIYRDKPGLDPYRNVIRIIGGILDLAQLSGPLIFTKNLINFFDYVFLEHGGLPNVLSLAVQLKFVCLHK